MGNDGDAYSAAVCAKDAVDHVDGMIVLVGLPWDEVMAVLL